MIGIIDYHGGNASSVANALSRLHFPHRLVSSAPQLAASNFLILPGVGSAAATLASLAELGLTAAIQRHIVERKRAFLGICIGYQLLFETSEESETSAPTHCWGFIKGHVRRFDAAQVRVPQIGWNAVTPIGEQPLFNGLSTAERYFYFVNSYYGTPQEAGPAIAEADYGGKFACMLQRDNIIATQFHLEKSGQAGLKLLHNIITQYSNPPYY